jgi:segregation and condensation protein B
VEQELPEPSDSPEEDSPAEDTPHDAPAVPRKSIQDPASQLPTGEISPDVESTDEQPCDDAADSPSSSGVSNGMQADFSEMHGLLESLLFVSGEPAAPSQLARALAMEEEVVVDALRTLAESYAHSNRGLRIQAHRDKYQIVTAPAAAPYIERFLNLDTSSKLSGPALETLAVVAYRQPVTRSQVEAVRGVDCAAVLRSLTQRGLIEEVGRLDVAGRPILYGVTELFMQHFGLTDLGELPPLEQTDADTLWAATALAELEGEASEPTQEPETLPNA